MAFIKTSDTILIKATLTEKGKKLLSRGKFKIAKFALGDDEVDYRLYKSELVDDDSYIPALKNAKMIEALKDTNSNIQFGLYSHDSGVLYLSEEEKATLDDSAPHAFIEYLPILIKNTKTTYAPTLRNDKYYVSINDETTTILNENLSNFAFLEANEYDKIKITIESGIQPDYASLPEMPEELVPTKINREKLILEKFLLDEDFIVEADNRIISNIIGIQQTSQFENYASGESIINFSTENFNSPAISLESSFDYYATYLLKGTSNSMLDYDITTAETTSRKFSNINGPRGSVTAFNVKTDQELQVNSTGTRDSRFVEFGLLEQVLFNEMPTRKFDYIDTTIYIVGATTNSSIQIPLRIIRYAGL